MTKPNTSNSAIETTPEIVQDPTPREEPSAQEVPRPDPTLLGVAIPLQLTIAALREVTSAWRQCLTTLRVALKAKLQKEASAAAPATSAPLS